MLTINQLNWSLGQSQAFKQLDLSVSSGEHIVLVGGSGSGKSTLLTLIADNQHAAIQFMPGTSSTMVMQQGALLDHLDVSGNLQLVQRYHDGHDKQLVADQLNALNIDTSLEQAPINQLSGGEMRRVAIARALLTKPDMILFDEPDAGLDIANLQSLAGLMRGLTSPQQEVQQKACITVSHNPYYIARIATHVYRLSEGKLELLADWSEGNQADIDYQQRQQQIQTLLSEHTTAQPRLTSKTKQRHWVCFDWLRYSGLALSSLLHWPKSWLDAIKIAGYSIYLSLITGLIFFALVGLMLGSTTIAVVKLLSDTALTGLVAMFVKPEMLLEMMGGVYVLYLAPAIGGMLFVARSGSMMSNWLGEMVRGKQVSALKYLGVPTQQYLTVPSLLGFFVSSGLMIVWFAWSVWFGSVLAAQHLFQIDNPISVMAVSQHDITLSLFELKTWLYSALISLTVVALGLAPKYSAHQVNIYTTKAIIYSTLSIALAELLIVLN